MLKLSDSEIWIPGPPGKLVLKAVVLEHFSKFRQRRCFSTEAGGQLFASFQQDSITIEVATGPYKTDRRSRYRFDPDRKKEQQDIDHFWEKRLHFIGNWHTHPEERPTPSNADLKNTRRRFKSSDHALLAFLMVIVGTAPFEMGGIFISLIDSASERPLSVPPPISSAAI